MLNVLPKYPLIGIVPIPTGHMLARQLTTPPIATAFDLFFALHVSFRVKTFSGYLYRFAFCARGEGLFARMIQNGVVGFGVVVTTDAGRLHGPARPRHRPALPH